MKSTKRKRQEARNYALREELSIKNFDGPITNRTKTGQKSRSKRVLGETEKQSMSTVIQARQRHHGCNADEAKNPMMGHVFGRKATAGDFGDVDSIKTKLRYEAGANYALEMHYCRLLMGYPPLTAQAMDFGKVRGIAIEGLDAQAKHTAASNRKMHLEGVLLRVSPQAKRVAVQCLLEDEESAEWWPDHMNAFLIQALDALTVEYFNGR